tara:strand:+ start:6361 stop:6846 length:486 start_codon:yes stop_codon:yes gene_type:complete
LPVSAGTTYYTPAQISAEVFSESEPEKSALWMTPERRQQAEALLGDAPRQARLRYLAADGRYLWTLSEIGKEKPITFGIVTTSGHIERIEVMVFREVRGDEIRLPQYTRQYKDIALTENGDLSQHIDGISGATYSVRTMKKVAKLALLLDRWANEDNAVEP